MKSGRISSLALAGFATVALWLAGSGVHGADAQVTVDVSRPGPAISPYLYGQFIEHLGRCIRDGIWAEKLRDRKFLLEPAKSPWQVVRPADAVFEIFHDPAGAYAGDHAMALWVRAAKGGRCGIRQGGIGLVAGKEYVGYVIVAHAAASTTPVEVRLAWNDGPNDGQSVMLDGIGPRYRKFPFRFRAGATTDSGSLSMLLSGPAHLWVACLSLMPVDNVNGMRADTLELMRRLNPPITRWPGGNFVSGYNWKDAIGDRDRRPPRWERAWNDVEDNDFGIDEFMRFCAEVDTEPYIAVNTGLGSVRDAEELVEYVTGAADTRWGAERARNGHVEPYRVTWWGIGNEMYGNWQLGNVPVERYVIRHNAYVAAMVGRNPKIKVIGVGAPGKWNDQFLPHTAANMDLLSGHHYTERKFRVPFTPEEASQFERGFAAYSDQVASGIRRVVTDFRSRLGKGNDDIDHVRLAVDEWGIVRNWDPAPDGPGFGAFEHYYTLGDAIAVGRALHEILRSADVVAMANWAQAVNVIGAIKTTPNHAVLDPVGHVLALYRAQLGGVLLPVQVAGSSTVDAVATRDQKSGVVSIALINFSPSDATQVQFALQGTSRAPATKASRIQGSNLTATNLAGEPESVTTTPLAGPILLDRPLQLPPHSITVIRSEFQQ